MVLSLNHEVHLSAYMEHFPFQFTRFSVVIFQEIMVGPQYQATVPILHSNRHSEKGKAPALCILSGCGAADLDV